MGLFFKFPSWYICHLYTVRLLIILNPPTLSFLVNSLMYGIISSKTKDTLTTFYYFFPILIPLISYSSANALAKTSGTMLNSYGQNGHPNFPHFGGNAFSIWNDTGCGLEINCPH